MQQSEVAAPAEEDGQALALQAIVDALRGLRFGSITIAVQDGVIVQVERLEKRRISRAGRREAGK